MLTWFNMNIFEHILKHHRKGAKRKSNELRTQNLGKWTWKHNILNTICEHLLFCSYFSYTIYYVVHFQVLLSTWHTLSRLHGAWASSPNTSHRQNLESEPQHWPLTCLKMEFSIGGYPKMDGFYGVVPNNFKSSACMLGLEAWIWLVEGVGIRMTLFQMVYLHAGDHCMRHHHANSSAPLKLVSNIIF